VNQRLLSWTSVSVGVVLWVIATPAQPQAPAAAPQTKEVVYRIGDLNYRIGDLSYRIGDLSYRIGDLSYRIGDLNYRVDDLGGKVENLQVKETTTEVRIDLSADVLFAFDKADLLPQAQQTLSQAAAIIREKAKGAVRIDGYTDAKGSDAYNQRLSERRAASVENWFKQSGHLNDVSFVTKGFGAKNPVAPNTKPDGSDDPDGRQKNRRVEITITKG
jgi:outer membrane protein OmpA-like peptidoglycan-associated protein